MLQINLNRIARKKGWNDVSDALIKGGFRRNKAWRMSAGRMKKWDLKDIEKLCEIFMCSVEDLFVLLPEKGKIYSASHPMKKLMRVGESTDVLYYIKNLPIEEVREIEEDILRKREEKKEKEK